MTSVASLTDYNITRERYESYLEMPVKERDIFAPFDGILFIDSGGFKFLHSDELDGSDFEVEIDQETIYEIQRRMGADIIVNLDHPISPDDDHEDRVHKAKQTATNVAEFLDLSADFEGARYLTLQGYNYSMMDVFLDQITDAVPRDQLHEAFDGVALGGLVPKKDNREALITAVTDCREVLREWGFADLPLHVLGISSRSIPLLAAIGVDSFDSTTYIYNAINGKYSRSLMESEPLDEADFESCDCRVCSSPEMVRRMRGEDVEYQKDKLGPVAMHNLIVHRREVQEIRRCIQTGETGPLVEYIESSIAQDKRIRRYAHQVVNQSLGGYF
jgi:tRNA-guanine family transglycosylase